MIKLIKNKLFERAIAKKALKGDATELLKALKQNRITWRYDKKKITSTGGYFELSSLFSVDLLVCGKSLVFKISHETYAELIMISKMSVKMKNAAVQTSCGKKSLL